MRETKHFQVFVAADDGKACSDGNDRAVRRVKELSDPRAAIPHHTTSEFTARHTLRKYASKIYISFKFYVLNTECMMEFSLGVAAYQTYRPAVCCHVKY